VFPTTSGSLAGLLTTAGLSGATFNVGVNTTGAGEGYEARIIVDPQRTAGGVASFFWMQAGGTLNARTYGPHEFDIEFLLNESVVTTPGEAAVMVNGIHL